MANDVGVTEFSETICLSDTIHFDFEDRGSLKIQEVIEHLNGLEKIGWKVPLLLEKLYNTRHINNQVQVRLANIGIKKMASGSFTDWLDMAVQVSFVGNIDEETKRNVMADIKNCSNATKLAALFGILVVGFSVRSCISPSSITNSGVIQSGLVLNISSSFQLPEAIVKPIVDEAIRKAVPSDINAALNFMKPAKKNGGAIKLSEGPRSTEIPATFVDETPVEYEKPLKQEHVETVNNTELQIRALDMDNPEKGWYVIIPAVLPGHRIKLELRSNIDRSRLSRLNVQGDVEVTYNIKSDGSKKPVKALLLNITE